MKRFTICLLLIQLLFLFPLIASQPEKKSYSSPQLIIGDQIKPLIPFIAQQRLTYFREYPYLYEGLVEKELSYLDWFSKLKSSAVAVAYEGATPVGYIGGTGMVEFDEHFKGSIAAFKNVGLKPEEYFYVSEAIVLLAHRGNKLCTRMAELLGQFAKSRGYAKACFVTESHAEHPLKPKTYRDVEALCLKMGCTKTFITLKFPWETLQADGKQVEQEHTLTYWLKNL